MCIFNVCTCLLRRRIKVYKTKNKQRIVNVFASLFNSDVGTNEIQYLSFVELNQQLTFEPKKTT